MYRGKGKKDEEGRKGKEEEKGREIIFTFLYLLVEQSLQTGLGLHMRLPARDPGYTPYIPYIPAL